ncbi:hypothetical protein [Photorhabdus akhurstii]|nr:hypothetical protein [Photorhabdus akhurstii]
MCCASSLRSCLALRAAIANRNALLFLFLENKHFIAGEVKITPWRGIRPG